VHEIQSCEKIDFLIVFPNKLINRSKPIKISLVHTFLDRKLIKTKPLCNALSNYLIILLEDIVYNYILYDFDGYVTYL